MGFFKNLKSDHDSAKTVTASVLGAVSDMNTMAAELAKTHAGTIAQAQSMNLGEQMAIAQRMQHIIRDGLPGKGNIVTVAAQGPGKSGNGTAVEIELSLTSGPGAPRNLTIHTDVMVDVATMTPGSELQVKIDPLNLDDAILWADLPTGPDARIAKLEQLAAMHATGVLPDDRFEQMKAAILAEE
jgi:hypothetical protein